MDDTISKVDNKNVDSIIDAMSAKDSKIVYYHWNDKNCAFEILEDNKEEGKGQDFSLKTNSQETEYNMFENGEIVVTSILDCGEHEYLQGVKINLYKINGLSPVLVESRTTDEKGNAIFLGIEEGCYRIIEIVDKRYFEKPKYINWNEIIIDSINKNQKVVVVNKIKKFVAQNKHKAYERK